MMNEWWTGLLLASLQVAVATALLLAVQALLRRYCAPRWRVAAWVLLALRLLLPINIALPAAPVQLPIPAALATPALPAAVSSAVAPGTLPDVPPAGDAGGVSAALDPQRFVLRVWLAGILVLLVWQAYVALRFRYTLRRAVRTAGPATQAVLAECAGMLGIRRLPLLCVCPSAQTPLLYGLLQPRVVLPREDYTRDELRLVLLHELVHHRRRDVWLKQLFCVVRTIHWFNPFVHFLARKAGQDIEMACDSRVLQLAGEGRRTAYGEAILAALPTKRAALPTASTHFSARTRFTRQRLAALFQQGKKRGMALFACTLAGLVLLCCCTAVADSKPLASMLEGGAPGGADGPTSVITTPLFTDALTGMRYGVVDGVEVYHVSSEAHLRAIALNEETLARHYEQWGDIVLSSTAWEPIGSASAPFTGVYDGGSQRIQNLYLALGTQNAGLFGVVEEGTVQNVVLDATGAQAGKGEELRAVALNINGVEGNNTVLYEEGLALAGSLSLDLLHILYYTGGDKHPYITETLTNNTNDRLLNAEIAMLCYDAEGNPLQMRWLYLFGDEERAYLSPKLMEASIPEAVEPGGVITGNGGWSLPDGWLGGEEHTVAYVVGCVVNADFEQGGHWENPDYAAWLKQYEGRKLDVTDLEGYYPQAVKVA